MAINCSPINKLLQTMAVEVYFASQSHPSNSNWISAINTLKSYGEITWHSMQFSNKKRDELSTKCGVFLHKIDRIMYNASLHSNMMGCIRSCTTTNEFFDSEQIATRDEFWKSVESHIAGNNV
eukprot:106860_1